MFNASAGLDMVHVPYKGSSLSLRAMLAGDVSASMQTRSGIGATRFDQALAEAATLVDALPRNGRMLLMTSGRRALLRSGFESDRGALRRVLAQLRPGDEAGRPREALALALSLVRGRDDARIYFLTDGAFEPDVDPGSPDVVFRVVGAPARNVAITRFDLRQERATEDRFEVLLGVRNYTDAPVTVPARASLDGRELFARTLELAPQAEQTLVLPFAGRALGRAIARIEPNDDLAADNQAFATANVQDALRVLLLSRGFDSPKEAGRLVAALVDAGAVSDAVPVPEESATFVLRDAHGTEYARGLVPLAEVNAALAALREDKLARQKN